MIVGVNEKLEKMMFSYQGKDDEVEFDDVMNCVVECVAAGDLWHVPVEAMEDGMNETDFKEGWILEKIPALPVLRAYDPAVKCEQLFMYH